MALLARLKPYNGKQYILRSYTVFGIKFMGDRGWYRIDEDVAAYLKKVKQRDNDPDSAQAFDVCTEAEAAAIEESEKKQALRRTVAEAEPAPMRVHNVARGAARAAARAVETGNDLTTADLAHRAPVSELEEALHPGGVPDEAPDMAPEISGEFDDDMAAAGVDHAEALEVDNVAASRKTPSIAPPKHHGKQGHGPNKLKKPTDLL